MATKFSPGEWVVIKSAEEIREFRGHILCMWHDDMYALCGKSFQITDVQDHEGGQILKGHSLGWVISSDMVKHVATHAMHSGDPAPEKKKSRIQFSKIR